jgi:hypothetical protein
MSGVMSGGTNDNSRLSSVVSFIGRRERVRKLIKSFKVQKYRKYFDQVHEISAWGQQKSMRTRTVLLSEGSSNASVFLARRVTSSVSTEPSTATGVRILAESGVLLATERTCSFDKTSDRSDGVDGVPRRVDGEAKSLIEVRLSSSLFTEQISERAMKKHVQETEVNIHGSPLDLF